MNPNSPENLPFPESEPEHNRDSLGAVASEEELRQLAEDIVRYCPSLTQLLLALASEDAPNPIRGLN